MVKQADIVLEARGLRKVFDTGGAGLEVLKGVDLVVRAGELVAVMGESGVGKSTLLHLLGTLDLPTAGQLKIAGTDVLNLGDQALSRFRNRHIGFVFQFHYLLPEFTALENVLLPARVAGVDRHQEALELMGSVGLADRLHHRPGALSAASASGWPWCGRWSPSRWSCWPTSRRAISTRQPASLCTNCSLGWPGSAGRLLW